jgi:tyrosyl-tRNA synthetase (EC 6.1.1.1)
VSQAMKILDPEKTTIVHNGDWILSMDLAGLLQVCSKFTVARILERDDFTKRYQSQTPIALHEFLYPVMQAFDSVQIKADVEMGGTDQLFNLLAGRELMEKMGMEPQIALTMPLLEGTDGVRKMSKSYGNYIGLTDAPKDMFGKTMSTPRRDDRQVLPPGELAPPRPRSTRSTLPWPTAPPIPMSSSALWAATCATPTTAPVQATRLRPSSTACSRRASSPTSPRSTLS